MSGFWIGFWVFWAIVMAYICGLVCCLGFFVRKMFTAEGHPEKGGNIYFWLSFFWPITCCPIASYYFGRYLRERRENWYDQCGRK